MLNIIQLYFQKYYLYIDQDGFPRNLHSCQGVTPRKSFDKLFEGDCFFKVTKFLAFDYFVKHPFS